VTQLSPKIMEILGGPNGAGKTTFAELILQRRRSLHFVNADVIASGMGAAQAPHTAIAASRLMLREIRTNLTQGISFAFESTLAGRMWANVIEEAHDAAYRVVIYFIVVRDLDLAFQRISARVAIGGHDIPPEVVERRFARSIRMFREVYAPMCDQWYVFDNSGPAAVVIARKENGGVQVLDETAYRKVILNA